MNRNRKIRLASCAMVAGLMISSSSIISNAAPLSAGATAKLVETEKKVSYDVTDSEVRALSGANLFLASGLEETIVSEIPEVEAAQDTQVTGEVSDTVEETEAKEENEFENIGIVQVENYVNIRSEANEEGEVVGKLYNDGAATVKEEEGDWYHVTSGNVEGYIKADLLEVGDEELAEAVSTNVASVNADTLYVRTDTSTDSEIIDTAANGDRLEIADVLEENEDWIKVNTSEGEGYVAAEYVDVERIYSVAESKEEEEYRLQKEREAAEAAAAAARQQSRSSSGNSGGGSGYSAPAVNYAPPSGGSGADVANYALQFVGNPYVYGGTSLTNGADCSGFVQSVYGSFGVGLPHSSSGDRSVGYEVDPSQMQAGDIVCYDGHVALATGNGTIVHASTPSSGITTGSAYYKNIVTVRRIF